MILSPETLSAALEDAPLEEASYRFRRTSLFWPTPLSTWLRWELPGPLGYLATPQGEERLGLGAVRWARRLEDLTPAPGFWLGGLSFDPLRRWEGWPEEFWFLPKLSLRYREGILEAIMLDEPELPEPSGLLLTHIRPTSREEFLAQLHTALQELGRGTLRKVVLARAQPERVGSSLEETLERLKRNPEARVFAFRLGAEWFVGASPEELLRLHKDEVHVDALAGSAPPGAPLLTSKNLLEHRWVVRYLEERLRPQLEGLTFPSTPGIRRLPGLLHLHTPFRGVLPPDGSLAKLVRSLHPTPAVAGLPQEEALAFLRAHEGWPRGLYAGALGSIAEGEALLVVALRSALIQGQRATLFAGCGIVEGSGEEEWDESELKLQAMREALR
jgi:isochorismate synthase